MEGGSEEGPGRRAADSTQPATTQSLRCGPAAASPHSRSLAESPSPPGWEFCSLLNRAGRA